MIRPLKIGLVGNGLNATEHRSELESHPLLNNRAKIIAGFDPDPEARERLSKMEGVKVASSFEEFLSTPNMEAIIISSPPQYHAEQAVAALEAGFHVFSEIPMALNKKDIEKIIDAENASGKVYQLGENYCFFPEVLYAGHLASSGKLGPVVYAEAEYLHDVTYRWRKGFHGDVNTPRIDSWYQLFDPMMYAHSIGPAQAAMGGIDNPMPFVEVVSFANDNGGYHGKPICSPAKAFQVALFKTEKEAIAKCANAYVFAREPTRIIIQVTGELGTYECYELSRPGRLFLADDHVITRSRHRKGKTKKIDEEQLSDVIPIIKGLYWGANARILHDWLEAIEKNKIPKLHAKIGANFCMAGIAASESARKGGKLVKIKTFTD